MSSASVSFKGNTRRSTLDFYEVQHTIGKGSTAKVKLVMDPSSNLLYAAKVFCLLPHLTSHYYRSLLQGEVSSLRHLSHKNIVNLVSHRESACYMSKSKGFIRCMYIILEYCPYGEIVGLLKKNGSLGEEITLYYFRQLIDTLECCNNSGYSHGDIKPENIMIGNDLGLRLVDFGLAGKITGGNFEYYGTDQYLPPEIRLKKDFDAVKADLFVAGVMLFILYVGCPPFYYATAEDLLYKHICTHNTDIFWTYFQRKRPGKVFTKEFKSLIEALLEFDPNARADYSQIRENSWFQKQVNETQVLEQIRGLIR